MFLRAASKTSWSLYAGVFFTVTLAGWLFGHWTDNRALLDRLIPWETVPAQLLVVIALTQFLRDCRPSGARGFAWGLLLLGFGFNLAGSVIWVSEATAGTFSYGLHDLFFGACIPTFALAAALFFIDLGGSFRRPQVWLDAATLTMALGAMLWQLWVGPALASGTLTGWRLVAPLGYAVGATAMLVLAVLAYMRIRDWRYERSLALLLAGAIVSFLADLLWVDVSARRQLDTVSVYQIAYCIGDLLLLAAIVMERRRPAPTFRAPRSGISPTSSVPAFAVLISIAVIVGAQAHAGGIRTTLPLVIAVLGAMLLAVREVGVRYEIQRSARAVAQQEADQRLTELARRSRDLIIVADAAGRLTYVSPAAERVLGVAPNVLLGAEVASILGDGNRTIICEFVSRIEQGLQEANEIEVDFEHPAAPRRVLQIAGSDEGAKSLIGGIALTIRDVTEQRNVERELQAMTHRQHATLSHEIHEGLAQELAGIAMLFQSLDRGNRMSAEELAILETLPAQLANAIEKARVLATSLSPIQAASGSLELAVRGLVERENKSGRMVIQCTSSIGAHDLPSVVAEECYCIVLEAIECAVRHPSSSRVIVSLTVISDALQIGLKWDADPRTASATNPLDPLRIIGHRVRQLRGALHLAPSSGGGLHCVATIPLKADRCVAGAEADGTSSPARLT